MEYPLSEIMDRYTIALLKKEKIIDANNEKELSELENEINTFISKNPDAKEPLLNFQRRLYQINSEIWDLESDIRKGKENILGLEEVGRRAITIRGFNKRRVGIKNEIVTLTGNGFIDVKMNHASE